MKCSQIKKRFSDFLTGEIDKTTRKEIEKHVTVCGSCRGELESLSAIWTKLGVLPEEQPSDSVRTRFYTALEKYKQSLEKEKARPHLGKFLDGWLERWAPRRPVFQFSLALMLLVVGLAAGYFLNAGLQKGGEIARLRQEVHQVRQVAEASLLRQESLSERLRGIGVTSRVEQSDEGTLEALHRFVSSDANINSRLAAIDALHLLPHYPLIRQELVQSLSEQTSPLVEIALTLTHHIKNL
jgi:anti-sigma factor RsiW